MSTRYTADGRRLSSMTHARRGHTCGLCGRVVFGNGGQVAHGRAHVRSGEAVELFKTFGTYPPTSSRFFVPVADAERIGRYENLGYARVTS